MEGEIEFQHKEGFQLKKEKFARESSDSHKKAWVAQKGLKGSGELSSTKQTITRKKGGDKNTNLSLEAPNSSRSSKEVINSKMDPSKFAPTTEDYGKAPKSQTNLEDVDDAYSYSTGSVGSVSSDEENENFNGVEHQVADADSESETKPTVRALPKVYDSDNYISPKLELVESNSPASVLTDEVGSSKSVTTDGSNSPESLSSKSVDTNESTSPNSVATNGSDSPQSVTAAETDLAQQIEQSKQFFKNFSQMYHDNKTEGIDGTAIMSVTKTHEDSPNAISLKSCSEDSFTPIRPSGKKRPKMFEDTDSDAEKAEEDFNIHFKTNHERKAKRTHLDEEQDSTPHTNTSKESKSRTYVSDFDQMLQKKRQERAKSNSGRRCLGFVTKNDDLIEQLIDQMEDAAYEDRCLNEQGLPATKKVAMLKLVASQLIKKDLQPLFLEHNILSTLAEWLSPLPSKCLPCLQIRDGILRILEDLSSINASLLKESGIGKTLMFLCKHPQETKKNRECCRRLIAQWARPIYNLTCDYRAMSKAERQERDIELSTRYKKQVAEKSSSSKTSQPASELDEALSGEQSKPVLRPGEQGWVPRARVPQPSTKDYVHRPQSQTNCQPSNRSKPQPNRYEALAKKHQNAKRAKGGQHSKVGLSIFGKNSL